MNAPDKNINQHPDFNKSDAAIDPNALHSFKNSKKNICGRKPQY